MIKHFTNLLVANSCYGCDGHLTIQEKFICFGCLSQMEETSFHENEQENELYYRLAGKIPLAGASSLFYFSKGGRLQEIMQYLKYKGAPNLGVFLGEYYGRILSGNQALNDFQAIIPVPLHRRRLLTRGYNQAEKIAIGLGKSMKLPVLSNLLTRHRQTVTQTQKGGLSRWENMAKAFRTKGVFPKKVILVDDVITTGSTLEACIRAMISGDFPPEEIFVLSIGVAKKD